MADTTETVFQALLGLLIFFLALGLGATLSSQLVRDVLRRPVGPLVGFGSQVLLLPAIAFALVSVFAFDDATALGLLIVGASPGGATSNIFTYWSHGNTALSIVMTVVSTTLSFATLPLLIWLYAERALGVDEEIDIPYLQVALTLLVVVVPVGIGILVKAKSAKWAARLESSGSVVGLLFLAIAFVFGIVTNTDLFDVGWEVWVCAPLLELFGLLIGYGFAFLARQPHENCVAIAFETGIQNSSLSIAIIALSFDDGPERDKILTFPLFYSFFLVVTSLIFVLVIRTVVGDLSPKDYDKAEGQPVHLWPAWTFDHDEKEHKEKQDALAAELENDETEDASDDSLSSPSLLSSASSSSSS